MSEPAGALERAQALLDGDRFALALPFAEQAVRAAPHSAAAHVALARCYSGLKRLPEALRSARAARGADPRDPTALAVMADLLLDSGQEREAESLAEELRRLEPAWGHGHVLLARLAMKGGSPRRALEHIDAALALSPDEPDLVAYRAAVLQQAGDAVGAEREARRAVGSAPASEVPHHVRGWIVALRGELDEAEAHFRTAVAASPADVEHRRGLVVVRLLKRPLLGAWLLLALRLDARARGRMFVPLAAALIVVRTLLGAAPGIVSRAAPWAYAALVTYAVLVLLPQYLVAGARWVFKPALLTPLEAAQVASAAAGATLGIATLAVFWWTGTSRALFALLFSLFAQAHYVGPRADEHAAPDPRREVLVRFGLCTAGLVYLLWAAATAPHL